MPSVLSKIFLGAGIASSLVFSIPSTTTYTRPEVAEAAMPTEAARITDAIYGAEGRCDHLHGESGEYGCYQYLPATWNAYSKIVDGKVVAQTGTNERRITEAMVQKWLDEGIDARGILLMWNQGSATGWGPGKKDCYAGTNKYGVHYDSCAYAEKGLAILKGDV